MNTGKLLTAQEAALAFLRGNKVEARSHRSDADWLPICIVAPTSGASWYSKGVFDCDDGEYVFRLAPESAPKKLRPYTWDEFEKRIGHVVKSKDGSISCLVIASTKDRGIHIGNLWMTLDDLLGRYTWLDGTPCGVEVEA